MLPKLYKVMITKLSFNKMFFKKRHHDMLRERKRNFFVTHYTPLIVSSEQTTSSLSVCSENFFLQIKQKEG